MTKNSPRFHPALFIIAVAVLAIMFWPRKPASVSSNTVSQKSASAQQVAALPVAVAADIDKAKTFHLASLERVAKGDPEGDALIDFYRAQTFYGTITGPGTFGFNVVEARVKSVMIIVASEAERRKNGFPTAANWQYLDVMRMVFTPQLADYSEVWAGIRLVHELSHARRYVTGVVPRKPSPEQERLEEIRAHRLEVRLTDRSTKGSYLNVLDAWLENRRTLPDAPKEWFRAPDEELYQGLQSMFPPAKSVHEDATRRGSLMFAMNERLAAKKRLDDDALGRFFNDEMFHAR